MTTAIPTSEADLPKSELETLDHRSAAVLLRPWRRPRLGDLRVDRRGRSRRRRCVLDRLRGRRNDRRDHRARLRRAGDQVPAGGRRRPLREQGVPQADADLLDHHLHAVGQLRRLRLAGQWVRPLLRPTLPAAPAAAGHDRVRADPDRDQLRRDHRVGGGQHDHDHRGGLRSGHRDGNRHHLRLPGQRQLGNAGGVQRRGQPDLRRSSPVSPSRSSP